MNPNQFIPTRHSLLSRLRSWDNQDSWREFFNTYWRLIYDVAIKAGLNDAEAQDVVQETVISVAKQMPAFRYDPSLGRFKGWLLQITWRRIADHLRKRYRSGEVGAIDVTSPQAAAALLDARPDASVNLESLWEEEWRKHLAQAAIAKVKERVPPEQLQMFEFSVIDRWPVRKVADALGVSIAQVYMARHRVGKIIKKEIQRLEQHMI